MEQAHQDHPRDNHLRIRIDEDPIDLSKAALPQLPAATSGAGAVPSPAPAARLGAAVPFVLTPDRVAHYAGFLKLPAQTEDLLVRGLVDFQRISELAAGDLPAAAKYLQILDVHSYQSESLKAEFHKSMKYLLSPDGLGGDGVFIRKDGDVAGYCLIYRVSNELAPDGGKKADLPLAFGNLRDRVNWPELGNYLTQVTASPAPIGQDRIYHLYDVAVPAKDMRSLGLGRLTLYLSRDVAVPAGSACVGFIAEDNYSSLLSMTKAGRLLGKIVDFDPYDGNGKRTFLSLNIMGREPNFNGQPIDYDPKNDPIEKLPKAIAEVVSKNGCTGLVGYNRRTGRLESVSFS